MSLAAAIEAKSLGSTAWSSGNFDLSIEHFTTAISHLPPSTKSEESKELSKQLYSNRSAALLKQKKVEEALKDAIKCIEIDQNWAKGSILNIATLSIRYHFVRSDRILTKRRRFAI